MLDKLNAALRFQQEALNLHTQRQEVLATNIANADTPGYQIRDIDLASKLKKVMQRRQDVTSVVALTMTSMQYILAQTLTSPTAELQYRIPDQPSPNGNTVDIDCEYTQSTDNSLQYQMSLSVLSGQIKGIVSVSQSGNQRMALLNIFDIVGSTLTAQSQCLGVAASNLANADNMTSPDGQPYQAKRVIFQVNTALGVVAGGVKVTDVIESQVSDKLIYEPGNPLADAKSYVKVPNIGIVGRMVNTMSASHSYQVDVEVLDTVKSMVLETFTLD